MNPQATQDDQTLSRYAQQRVVVLVAVVVLVVAVVRLAVALLSQQLRCREWPTRRPQ